jgi:hypothetical protein
MLPPCGTPANGASDYKTSFTIHSRTMLQLMRTDTDGLKVAQPSCEEMLHLWRNAVRLRWETGTDTASRRARQPT